MGGCQRLNILSDDDDDDECHGLYGNGIFL